MRNRWLFRLYNLLVLLALPVVLLFVALRWRRRLSKGLARGSERWGRLAPEDAQRFASGRWWWVHAVSMGEVKAIEAFLRRAPEHAGARIVLSCVTPEALAWAAEQRIAEVVIAAPIDLPWVVRRVFRQVRPQLFVSVESEFWPNLLREARRSGAKVALINGRMSEHSFGSYRKVKPILPALWDCLDLWTVRQQQDAERFLALGVPAHQLKITGNLKYDAPLAEAPRRRPADQGPVIVLGSTREKEEAALWPVIESLRGRWPALRVIWAPRHVDRVTEIEVLLNQPGHSVRRKTAFQPQDERCTDLIWDSMGDLLDAYRQADVAVIGGSFVPKGGQNPIEPAALEVPVVFGPSMENFPGIAEALVQQGGARQVTVEALGPCLETLLASAQERQAMGRRARLAVQSQQGATERALQLLEALVHA